MKHCYVGCELVNDYCIVDMTIEAKTRMITIMKVTICIIKPCLSIGFNLSNFTEQSRMGIVSSFATSRENWDAFAV